MGMHGVFINELGIRKHITLFRRFNCEECNQLIGRGERYWEINHFGTCSAFDDGHMHILCTTCAPRIENAETIYATYYAKFQECDYFKTHIRIIEKMVKSSVDGNRRPIVAIATAIPPITKLQDGTSIQLDKNCPDCGKPMILKNGTHSCFDCDVHIDAECEN